MLNNFLGKKQSVHDIAAFIRESFDSHLNSLTDEQYTNALLSESEDELWIIDYFAPVWYLMAPKKLSLSSNKPKI